VYWVCPEEPLHQALHVQVTTCSGRGAAKHSRPSPAAAASPAHSGPPCPSPLSPLRATWRVAASDKARAFPPGADRSRPEPPPPTGSPGFQTRRAGASRWAQGSRTCPGSSGGDAGAGRGPPARPGAWPVLWERARAARPRPASPARGRRGRPSRESCGGRSGAERRGAGGGVSSSRARSAAERRGGRAAAATFLGELRARASGGRGADPLPWSPGRGARGRAGGAAPSPGVGSRLCSRGGHQPGGNEGRPRSVESRPRAARPGRGVCVRDSVSNLSAWRCEFYFFSFPFLMHLDI